MHVVVRSYSGQGATELFDLLGEREEDVRELISGVPGFVRYAAFRSGDGGMTVTICEDKAGTDESSKRAAGWVEENVTGTVDPPAIAARGLHADRMWAVRDVALDTFTTARRWPVLLQCSARFVEDPAGRSAEPGDVLEVIVSFPDGSEVSSSDPAIDDHLSELIGKPARLESLP